MKLDSIIFDLDGTMWDTAGTIIDSWNDTISAYKEVKNKITIDDMKSIMGLRIEDVAKKLFPCVEEKNRLEIVNECCINECKYLEEHGGILYDKLEETLSKLSKQYKMFIVSNCQCGYIESFFKAHKLDKYFVDFENPGRTGLGKGENIKLIIERNNLKAPIYVGDTEGDLKSARFAGIPFVYARYGFGEAAEYDYAIDSFEELLKIVHNLFLMPTKSCKM